MSSEYGKRIMGLEGILKDEQLWRSGNASFPYHQVDWCVLVGCKTLSGA